MWIVSAGEDGYIRWWNFLALSNAETTDEEPQFELSPSYEILVGKNVSVKQMVRGKSHWIIQDGGGGLWRLNVPDDKIPRSAKDVKSICLQRFHGKGINCMDASPVDHFAVTCGKDGAVQCWDYGENGKEESTKSSKKVMNGTVVHWAPNTVDSNGRTVVVGFENGVVRMLLRGKSEWKLSHAMRPHSTAVTLIQFSNKGGVLATAAAEEKTVWFFEVEQGGFGGLRQLYEPIGFVKLDEEPLSFSFRADDTRILISLKNSAVLELPVPQPRDTSKVDTFDITDECKRLRKWQYSRPDNIDFDKLSAKLSAEAAEAGGGADTRTDEEKTAALEEAANEIRANKTPEIAGLSIYCSGSNNNCIATMQGPDAGMFLECQLVNKTAIHKASHPSHDSALSVLRYSSSRKLLLSGSADGTVHVRSSSGPSGPGSIAKKFICSRLHDASLGSVTSVATSFDDNFLLSTGEDEMFFVQQEKMLMPVLSHVRLFFFNF
eukprot:GSMAST32.ASY1.ANO1.2203.1 assembled CDS